MEDQRSAEGSVRDSQSKFNAPVHCVSPGRQSRTLSDWNRGFCSDSRPSSEAVHTATTSGATERR